MSTYSPGHLDALSDRVNTPESHILRLQSHQCHSVDRHRIEGHEIITGTVKTTGNGAHVLVPKDWRGAKVKIVRAERFSQAVRGGCSDP